MLYALLIAGDEAGEDTLTPAETGQMLDGYRVFGERNAAAIQSGQALQPTATSTTLRVRRGERLLTDGPYAETREQLGGFYIVDVPGLDEALALAAQIPHVTVGSVEVRPVMTFEES